MATSLAPDAKNEEWADPGAPPTGGPKPARSEWLGPLIGLALFGAFLSFVVNDYPLRTLIAGN